MDDKKPDVAAVLSRLKDFQLATVDYVFRRLYLDDAPTKRFLIADEVGLGKTLVARGLIARTIDRLWEQVERVDVIYICSNADIARQNINRLNVTGREDFALASRITMLPVTLKDLKKNRLNFVSFTPGTSFDLKSSKGTRKERALLYWLLQQAWNLKGAAPLNVLQGDASRDSFRGLVDEFRDQHEIDEGLGDEFRLAILQDCMLDRAEGRPDLRERFDSLCERFARSKDHIPAEDAKERTAVIAELRTLLAVTCLEALEPDLIILDEFQRFKHLLEGRDTAGELAQKLFEFPENRILLLSATPYKMYTLDDETEEDHYGDFLRTLSFLLGGETGDFADLLRDYRREIFSLAGGQIGRLRELKQEIEARLRQVMVRTERLAVSEDRNGMLVQVVGDTARLEAQDVAGFLSLQRVSRLLDAQDALEYWKAAPYLLNFMDDYMLKQAFEEGAEDKSRTTELAQALKGESGVLLNWQDVARYKGVDPGNARLRALWADTVGKGLWRLLWIPPSLPYYQPAGPFALAESVTKRLVFSSWTVVPKAIASLLSYEAERNMFVSLDPESENTAEARKRRRGLLRFSRADMRLTGMPVLGILYPSHTLASACDPLRLAAEAGANGQPPTLEQIVTAAENRIQELLTRVRTELNRRVFSLSEGGAPDESWYWAAPILFDCLDGLETTRAWLRREECASEWSAGEGDNEEDGEQSAWGDHVQTARKASGSGLTALVLGPIPADLVRVMALVGIAGPTVAALRALGRLSDDASLMRETSVRDAAGAVGWAFRTLFNIPEVMALIRGIDPNEPYWLRVVEYCVNGGLQAVLDEYVHVLWEAQGLLDKTPAEAARVVANEIRTALSLRTAALGVDVIEVGEGVRIDRQRMRARFALRFGEDQSDDGRAANRAEQVRTSFNSPFWPFVLASTSVGQEGLDFHCYCHAVVHWNLPANPVDLEQREGRVHRYKGHAVRKNVARRFGLTAAIQGGGDPWQALFEAARASRGAASDVTPYWVFALPDGAVIERHVPAIPLSRDVHRLLDLRKALAVYRMVFGQARQEELVSYLLTQVPEPLVRAATEELRIDLSPASSGRVPPIGAA